MIVEFLTETEYHISFISPCNKNDLFPVSILSQFQFILIYAIYDAVKCITECKNCQICMWCKMMHRSSVYTKHKTENVGLETSVGKSENFNFIPVAQICNMYNTCGYLSFFHNLNIY